MPMATKLHLENIIITVVVYMFVVWAGFHQTGN